MSFEAIATCIEGLESITQLEIKEILKQESKIIIPSRVIFKVKDDKDLANFIYNSRSSIKAYKLITKLEFKDLEDLLKKIEKVKFPKIRSPFAVKCDRVGEHGFSSIDLEKEIGEIINKNSRLKVDLKDPTTIILIDIIGNNCFVGIDYTGIKLSKRDYRIKLIPNPLNPCLAYTLLRVADIKPKDIVLDPSCKSGEILIEAALYLQNIPVNKKAFDKLAFTKLINFKPKDKYKNKKLELYAIDNSQNSLRCTEINAKIAGINKSIKFSKQDIEWLDTKFKKGSINKIITFPQIPTNRIPIRELEQVYKELFYQAEFILNKKGTITVLTTTPEVMKKYAELNKFKLEKELKIRYINEDYTIQVFKK